jgi:sugar phosphate isomerase/epimerase
MKNLARRRFLSAGSAAGAAVALNQILPGVARAASSSRALGIELYTVEAALETDMSGTLKALKEIGYKNVETGLISTIAAKDLRKGLDDTGLACPSAHLRFSSADPGPLFEDAHTLGAHYAVSSVLMASAESLPGTTSAAAVKDFLKALSSMTADDWKRTAELANWIGAKAKQAGLQYAYHNHNFEFKDQGNGQTGYDLLLSQTDPELVKFELDCGWMVAAGHSPVDYFRKYPGRYRLIHVKDFVAGSKPTTALGSPDGPKGTELGKGYIDYKPIFAAAARAGVEYYFSEQEPPITGMTALDAAKVNYEYMLSV